LEVRDHPLRVDAVAAEAAAELVVDAALAHALERGVRDVGLALAQAQLEIARMRKFRRAAEAAEAGIEAPAQLIEQRAQPIGRELGALRGASRQSARERFAHFGVLARDVRPLVTPDRGDALAQLGKTRQPKARRLGKI